MSTESCTDKREIDGRKEPGLFEFKARFSAVRLALDKPWLKRLIIAGAIVAPVAYSFVINYREIDSPPAWDSAVTVSPAALTIVDLDFDVWAVAQLPSSPEGGPSTHATSIYTIALAILISALGVSTAFSVAHLISIALIGLLTSAAYLLARERASVLVSALVAATIGLLPVVVQQAADIYLDLPLAVVTTFACWTASRRQFWWTGGLALVGVAIKTSGVFLLPLLLISKPADRSFPRHLLYAVPAGLVASVPFLLSLATTHRFTYETNPFADPILIRSSASLLVLTVDVFLVLAIYVLVMYGRARSRMLDRPSQASIIVVASFLLVHLATILLSGTIAILPRYYIAVLPAVLAALIPPQPEPAPERLPRYRVGVGLVIVLAVFSCLNVRGDFYPLPDHDFYVAAERSTRAQDLLELHVIGTRELVATDLPILVERQVYFRLEYPGMGYVDKTPDDMTPVFIEPDTALPDTFAMLIERRFTNPLVEIEEAALDLGYELDYQDFSVGPYESQLVVASR